jgi:hypothetical protein
MIGVQSMAKTFKDPNELKQARGGRETKRRADIHKVQL